MVIQVNPVPEKVPVVSAAFFVSGSLENFSNLNRLSILGFVQKYAFRNLLVRAALVRVSILVVLR
jgi:hypothetical protein